MRKVFFGEISGDVGGEIGHAGDRRKIGLVRERGQSRQLDTLGLALKVKGFTLRVQITTGDDMSRDELDIYVLDVNVRPVEGGLRDQTLQWLAAQFAWSKTQIGAATHRIRNSSHRYLTGNVRHCVRG